MQAHGTDGQEPEYLLDDEGGVIVFESAEKALEFLHDADTGGAPGGSTLHAPGPKKEGAA
jgi:hypothetical protein